MSTNREVIERYIAALGLATKTGDYAALDQFRHSDFIEDWPQSGERIRGTGNMRQIDEHRPNRPASGAVEHLIGSEDRFALTPLMTVVHIAGTGDVYTVAGHATYEQGDDWWFVMICTLKDRRVWRATTYFCPPLEAPAWRAAWTEPIADSGQPGVHQFAAAR
jgi:hypothetical protein